MNVKSYLHRVKAQAVLTLCLIGVFVVMTGARLFAADSATLENQVKGAFLIKFGSFVEWPAGRIPSRDRFIIGIVGNDQFGKDFYEAVKNERVNGRAVILVRGKSVEQMRDCQIVFVTSEESSRADFNLRELTEAGVLTVGDTVDFATRGGIIGFVKEGGKVRFEINTLRAEKSGLKISSKLLQVAKIVTEEKDKR